VACIDLYERGRGIVYSVVNGVNLRYFKTHEFTDQQTKIAYDKRMDSRLLVMLDILRHMHGKPIRVSNGRGAIGRETGNSYHNWKRHGSVQAIDIIPSGIINRPTAHAFIMLADAIGFTGVGLYPEWLQGIGFHVDVGGRYGRWGMVGGQYVSIDNALMATKA
jgi:hypothetical protein